MGGYVDGNLLTNESVLHRGHLSRIIYLRPFLLLIVGIFLGLDNDIPAIVPGAVILLGVFGLISAFIVRKTSEFAVTNKRVILKVGLIRRRSLEIMLNKVESIDVNQGILGRLLNFGSISVTGTGGTRDPFHRISAPLLFRRAVQEQLSST